MQIDLTLKRGETVKTNISAESTGIERNSKKNFNVLLEDVSVSWVSAKAPSSTLPNSNVVVTLHEFNLVTEDVFSGRLSLSSDPQSIYVFQSEFVDRPD